MYRNIAPRLSPEWVSGARDKKPGAGSRKTYETGGISGEISTFDLRHPDHPIPGVYSID
jgi:hypothetical protein